MPTVRCKCGHRLMFEAADTGRKVRCPRCAAVVRLSVGARPVRSAAKSADKVRKSRDSTTRRESAGARKRPVPRQPAVRSLPLSPEEARAARRQKLMRRMRKKTPEQQEEVSFWRRLPGALLYPFMPKALVAWLVGIMLVVLAVAAVNLIRRVGPSLIPVAVVLGAAVLGYAVRYIMDVIAFTGLGSDEPPGWPDPTDYTKNVVFPFLYAVVIFVVSCGPYLLALGAGASWPLRLSVLALGQVYVPGALLCVAVSENAVNLNPGSVLRAIAAAPLRYATPCALFVLLSLDVQLYHSTILTMFEERAIIGLLLLTIWCLYLLLVIFHMFGLIYHTSQDRLKWLG